MKNKKTLIHVCLLLIALGINAYGQDTKLKLETIMIPEKLMPTPKGFGKPTIPPNLDRKVKNGILLCDKLGIGCMVDKMPLLSQTDPRIDADVADMGPVGCYDTSVVTVLNTALAHRNPANSFIGRTKEFDSITGTATQPKEIKQISYQYRTAKAKKPLYFTEAVADFNNGKIIQKCNPYIYGDCDKLGNIPHATNLFGTTGRVWMANAGAVTNEEVIKLMEQGYVVLLAFMRYYPNQVSIVAKPLTAQQVPLKFNSYHKVVVSGFRRGSKYPLIINDVGNGQRYNVRLGTDIENRTFQTSKSNTPFTNAEFIYKNSENPNTKHFIEYEGTGQAINDGIFFLQHYDYLRIK